MVFGKFQIVECIMDIGPFALYINEPIIVGTIVHFINIVYMLISLILKPFISWSLIITASSAEQGNWTIIVT